jgi:hypothetical protein
MKLSEVIDPTIMTYAKKIKNPDEIGNVTIDNVETQYRVGDVIFDNKNGLGATPNNREVNYFGFTTTMTISSFLKLAADHGGRREESAIDLRDLIKQGYGIATPMLYLRVQNLGENDMTIEVSGHEGRARSICCQKYFNLTDLPVQIIPTGFRSKHMTDKIIDQINKIGITPEDGGSPIKNPFKSVLK